jgi:GTP-binding protein
VAGWLRRSGKPVLVVANKAEGRAGAMAASEAWSLGLGEPIPISAEHAEGIGELAAAIVERLGADAHGDVADGPDTAAAPAAEDDAEWIRLAVVGRPNVGKSSLVNRLIAQERLLTGPEPGLTRDSVQIAWEWAGRRIELVDTAGLRRRARIEAPVEKLAAAASLRAIRAAHVVLLMVDATAPLEHQDLAIAGRVVEEGRALVLAANKWDLVGDREAVLAELRHRAAERLAQLRGLPVLPLSVRTGQGLDRLMPLVIDTFERWRRRVPTPAVNRWLAEALERHAPPLVQGRRLKLRFATQTTNRPPTFVLFANKPASAIPESYLRFLAGSLRDAFDLDGVPLRLRIRHGANPYEERKR